MMVARIRGCLVLLSVFLLTAAALQAQTLAPGVVLPRRQAVVPNDERLTPEPPWPTTEAGSANVDSTEVGQADPGYASADGSDVSTPAFYGSTGDSSCEPLCSSDGCGVTDVYDPWASKDVFRRGQFYVQGWLSQGFTWNPAEPGNRFNSYVGFNDRVNEYEMNQLYVSMGRRVNTDRCQWDWGGRVDLLYGTDYFFTTATGLETRDNGAPRWNSEDGPRNGGHAALYGLAMPQLYTELYAPWGYGTTFKFGHFYTLLGYESVMAPDNFFYSHTYAKLYGEPFTHTGMLGSYGLTQQTNLLAGFTRGWNTWEDPNQEMGFLGGITRTSCDKRANLAFALHAGKEDHAGDHQRTSYSLVYSRRFTDRFTYVFQHDLGIEDDGALVRRDSLETTDARWYGITQYFLYDITCKTSLGFRLEWFRDEEMARLLGGTLNPYFTGGNAWAATVGLNWKPCSRFTVRPELRWDWSDTEGAIGATQYNGLYNEFGKKNQFTGAVDAVWVF